jgi:hypothetical protein
MSDSGRTMRPMTEWPKGDAACRRCQELEAEVERLKEGIADIRNGANGAMQYETTNMMLARWQLVVAECERLIPELKGMP